MNVAFSGLNLAAYTEWMRIGAPVMIALALFIAGYAASAEDGGPVMRSYLSYVSWLDRQLRTLFIFYPAQRIVVGQALALFLLLLGQALIGIPLWYVGVVLTLLGPALWVRSERGKRLKLLEDQLDGVMLALANALRTTPSLGAALQSIVHVSATPFAQELDLAVKEMKVGSSIDQALLHMSARIGSRSVDSAVSAILIGRQVGGNLPKVLSETAAALRESRRLDGVLRTKTAEARYQLIGIAGVPILIVFGIQQLMPEYFTPLFSNLTGYLVIIAATSCWVGSLIIAKAIMRVNI